MKLPIPRSVRNRAGFSVVELLSVIAIIAVISAAVGPAVNAISGGNRMTGSASEIAGMLEQARSHAMAHNTWVFVALTEVDAAVPANAPDQSPGTGRVVVTVLGSLDGTRNFDPANLVTLSRVRSFDNLHLEDEIANSGNLTRPNVPSEMRAGNSAFQAEAPLNWSNGAGGATYTFSKVIQFDPSGTAGVQSSHRGFAQWMEIGLTPTKGNDVVPTSDHAALVLDGVTGSVKVYRP